MGIYLLEEVGLNELMESRHASENADPRKDDRHPKMGYCVYEGKGPALATRTGIDLKHQQQYWHQTLR
jgi:hypothetical protein